MIYTMFVNDGWCTNFHWCTFNDLYLSRLWNPCGCTRQGILETEDFKGEALVVYHTGKFTGTHDKGVGAPGVIRESRRVVVLDAVLVFI